MKVKLRTDEFITRPYEMELSNDALLMRSEDGGDVISVPYEQIRSFRFSESKRMDIRFELLTGVLLYEGTVVKRQQLSAFIDALKTRLPGTIRIEYVKA